MPAETTNLKLFLYNANEYGTTFRSFWQSVNGNFVAPETLSAFQKIDDGYAALSARVDNVESLIHNADADEFNALLEATY